MSDVKFHRMTKYSNLLRPTEVEESVPPIARHESNLIKYYAVSDSTKKREDSIQQEASSKVQTQGPQSAGLPIIKSYSQEDLIDAVLIIKQLNKKQTEIKDIETASLIYYLLEKQSKNNASMGGLFEMLKEEDPHRTRAFRRDIIQPLREFFPSKPVAKLFTEAMSKEWKAEALEASKQVVEVDDGAVSKGFDKLLIFNTRFPKWLSLFVNLKRKSVGTSSHRLDKLRTSKTGAMVKSFLYLLFQSAESEKEFRSLLGNIYSLFKRENEELFAVFKNNDLEEQQKVFAFLKSVYNGLLIYEVLTQDCNILKLEGPSAQSICPDKRVFTIGHMKRAHKEAHEGIALELGEFGTFLEATYNVAAFSEFTFNRKDVFVKYMQAVASKKLFFTYHGQVDFINNLKCTLEEGF
ncbi:hypothetical protein MJH12_16145 [bacterium]|nr:hypothetical protein [bacterium]